MPHNLDHSTIRLWVARPDRNRTYYPTRDELSKHRLPQVIDRMARRILFSAKAQQHPFTLAIVYDAHGAELKRFTPH